MNYRYREFQMETVSSEVDGVCGVNDVQCSAECDGGERRRLVVCLSADNLDVVPDSLCNMTARPVDVEHCNLHRCAAGIVCHLIFYTTS